MAPRPCIKDAETPVEGIRKPKIRPEKSAPRKAPGDVRLDLIRRIASEIVEEEPSEPRVDRNDRVVSAHTKESVVVIFKLVKLADHPTHLEIPHKKLAPLG
jgi:hypothetical protein